MSRLARKRETWTWLESVAKALTALVKLLVTLLALVQTLRMVAAIVVTIAVLGNKLALYVVLQHLDPSSVPSAWEMLRRLF